MLLLSFLAARPAPAWYKSNEYRSRAVREPRGVLSEFGVELSDNVEVRVWDSTSERRYLVVPQRNDGVEDWDEASLARLVTCQPVTHDRVLAARSFYHRELLELSATETDSSVL